MDVVEYTPPGGESLEAVEARAVEFFCDLCRYEVCEYGFGCVGMYAYSVENVW